MALPPDTYSLNEFLKCCYGAALACIIRQHFRQLLFVIACDAVIGEKPAEDVTGDVATIAPGVTIGDRAVIGPKAMVYNDVEEGQEQC